MCLQPLCNHGVYSTCSPLLITAITLMHLQHELQGRVEPALLSARRLVWFLWIGMWNRRLWSSLGIFQVFWPWSWSFYYRLSADTESDTSIYYQVLFLMKYTKIMTILKSNFLISVPVTQNRVEDVWGGGQVQKLLHRQKYDAQKVKMCRVTADNSLTAAEL